MYATTLHDTEVNAKYIALLLFPWKYIYLYKYIDLFFKYLISLNSLFYTYCVAVSL